MNDEERWINLEGPEPPRVRRLMDAVRSTPQRSPEEVARMKRSIRQGIAARQWRERRPRVLATVAAVVALAAAVALGLGRLSPESTTIAKGPPTSPSITPAPSGEPFADFPLLPDEPDAGATRGPKRHPPGSPRDRKK